jgi:hypothetical protein
MRTRSVRQAGADISPKRVATKGQVAVIRDSPGLLPGMIFDTTPWGPLVIMSVTGIRPNRPLRGRRRPRS